jgi:hypothetical protein
MKIKFLFLIIFSTLLFIGCQLDKDIESNGFSSNFGNQVLRDFSGKVLDINELPVKNATISIGDKVVQTDVNGVFVINGANVHEKFAYITAKKSGYIDGSRTVVPTNGKNHVKIMMISNTPVQTIQSGVNSEVMLPNGTKVNFDGAFQNENGTSYSGSVQVAMYHLETSNQNINNLMPGMLYAEDANGQEKMLETFGMMNVELKGASGQKLQIASGHKAQITMTIDNSQLTSAPNSIPLWHFDEEKGYWKEDGSAQKIGNKYVGTVSHFSWWNCDSPIPAVILNVNVTDENGNPLPYIGVGLIRNNSINSIVLQTNDNGNASGLIPINEMFGIKLYDLCGNVVYTSSVGPFLSDSSVSIVLDNIVKTTVTGNLVKCNKSKVLNGYVELTNGNQTLISNVTNGVFNFETIVCGSNNNFNLVGYDLDDMQTTGNISSTFSSSVTDVGNIPVCNSITEFISYKVNDEPTYYIYNNFDFSPSFNEPLNINSNWGLYSSPGVQIVGPSTNIGEYSIPSSEIGIFFRRIQPNRVTGYQISNSTNGLSCNIKINKYGDIGDFVDITFSGKTLDPSQSNQPINISGVIHVIRDH